MTAGIENYVNSGEVMQNFPLEHRNHYIVMDPELILIS